MSWWDVLILSFVEGITEFLPVSSTGHLILTSAILGIEDNPLINNFNVIIQFGAILSVVVLYRNTFLTAGLEFYKKLVVGFLPAGVLGFLFKKHIESLLSDVSVVAYALFVGGILLILIDRKQKAEQNSDSKKEISYRDAFLIGVVQCFAFVPGVSRSAATILGGLSLGHSRKTAAEFSFFLAVPTLTGATVLKTIKLLPTLDSSQASLLLGGIVLSFIFALIAIRFFIQWISKHSFAAFGVYRILIGGAILILLAMGYNLKL